MSSLLALIEQYGLLLVFANIFVEQLGAPIPAYPTLIITGALSQHAGYSWMALLATAVAAAALADCLWYAAGKRHGRKVMATLCRISLSPDSCIQQAQSFYARWGTTSLLVAKFIPGVASVSSAMAGISGTRFRTFIVFDALGTSLWAGSAIYLGSLFSSTVDDLLNVLQKLGLWGMLLLGVALLAFLARRWLQRRQFLHSLRMARMSVGELRTLQETGVPVTIVDVRPAELQTNGRIPGAMTLNMDDLANPAKELKLSGEVVVYCACPNETSAAIVAKELMMRGVSSVRPLSGGLDAWTDAGYAIETPTLPGEAK